MPREKEGYRDNLIRLDQKFPNQELLNMREFADYAGINWRTAKKHYPFRNGYISKVEAARALSV